MKIGVSILEEDYIAFNVNYDDSSINDSFYLDQGKEQDKKDKKKQSEELANLIALFNQVKEIVALSDSGSDVTGLISKESIAPNSDKMKVGDNNQSQQTKKTEKIGANSTSMWFIDSFFKNL